jgi:hypothetical protein
MPRTTKGKRPAGGFVELAPGITIPTDFTGSNQLVRGGKYAVRIRTDPVEKEPRVVSFSLTFEEPPTVRDLADEQVRRIAGLEIALASAQIALNRGEPAFLAKMEDFDQWRSERTEWHRSHATEVKEILRGRRGRPERTDESKVEILDYYRRHGIHETLERFGLAERTVRRYIAEAKKVKGEH